MVDAGIDEMVVLQHRAFGVCRTAIAHSHPVEYSRDEDIASALKAEHIVQLSSEMGDANSPQATTSTQVPTSAKDAAASVFGENDATEGSEADEEEVKEEFTPEETEAAIKIIRAYRKYMERKVADKDSLTELRRRTLRDYQSQSETMTWRDATYRMLYRRAVPRLFLALERLKVCLHAAKTTAKANLLQLTDNDHDQLESVHAGLEAVS